MRILVMLKIYMVLSLYHIYLQMHHRVRDKTVIAEMVSCAAVIAVLSPYGRALLNAH